MRYKHKVVITDHFFADSDIEIGILQNNNIECLPIHTKSEEKIISNCRDADGIIVQLAPITKEVIESLERCKIIARYGVGYDNVDVDTATKKGIIVSFVPDYCIDDVAEHTIGLLLDLVRKITLANNNVKNLNWNYTIAKPIYRLCSRTMGLVGFGNIARSVAYRAKGLGMEIIAYDPYVKQVEMEKLGVKKVSFPELLENADVISIHVPLSSETYHLFGKEEFNAMKEQAFIINVSRGAIIDEKSLIDALSTGKIAGAAVDVLEIEPPQKDNPLLGLDNIIITPHMAWYSEESEYELRSTVACDVVKVLNGGLPKNIVNKELLKQR